MRVAKLLDLVPYVKADAIRTLEQAFGWRYYGAKHFESRWTRFFQGYWLPRKFGYDKRLAHYSSLILSGQISRDEALTLMNENPYTEEMIREDRDYILRKLQLSEVEFDRLVHSANRRHQDYPTSRYLNRLLTRISAIRDSLRG
jgi:hypothetical protein